MNLLKADHFFRGYHLSTHRCIRGIRRGPGSMSAWLKDHPDQAKAFRGACEQLTASAPVKTSRLDHVKSFVIYRVIVPLLQVFHLYALAYRLGGVNWGCRVSKQKYLCSKTRFIFDGPGRAATIIKRWALALFQRRKKKDSWEVLVNRTIALYVRDCERRIRRNAKLYEYLRSQSQMGTTDEIGPITDEELADLKKALDPVKSTVIEDCWAHLEGTDDV